MSSLSAFLTFVKNDLKKEFIPIAIGALQEAEKTPGALGIAAAEAYVLGNAPAALLQEETSVIQQGISDLQARLTTLESATQVATAVPAAQPAK